MTLKWTHGYSTETAQVGKIGEIVCAWNHGYIKNDTRPSGYRVSFCGTSIITIFADLDKAKAAGIALARRKLAEALAEATQ